MVLTEHDQLVKLAEQTADVSSDVVGQHTCRFSIHGASLGISIAGNQCLEVTALAHLVGSEHDTALRCLESVGKGFALESATLVTDDENG